MKALWIHHPHEFSLKNHRNQWNNWVRQTKNTISFHQMIRDCSNFVYLYKNVLFSLQITITIKHRVLCLGLSYWRIRKVSKSCSKKATHIDKYSTYLKRSDDGLCFESTSLPNYPLCVTLSLGNNYLTSDIPMFVKRIIVQVRMTNVYCHRIIIKKKVYALRSVNFLI